MTPACSIVMFSNVPINSSLEAGIVLRQINAKDGPPTDMQRDVVTRVNKGCCARCTTHVPRMTCMEKKNRSVFPTEIDPPARDPPIIFYVPTAMLVTITSTQTMPLSAIITLYK